MSIKSRIGRLEEEEAAELAELNRLVTLECQRAGPEVTREVLEEVAAEFALGEVTGELIEAIMRWELCR